MAKTISESQLLKVHTDLTVDQIQKFFTKTPDSKISKRPAKGGGEWSYVKGSYVTQVLNSLFGFNWSFEVLTTMQEALATAQTGSVVVQGRLKVKIGDEWITKEQYGRKEVAFKKNTGDKKEPLDFGNDMKAAATDAKKKCASELGLFADVYSQEDFLEVKVIADDGTDIDELEKLIGEAKTDDDLMNIIKEQSPEVQKMIQPAVQKRFKEIKDGATTKD